MHVSDSEWLWSDDYLKLTIKGKDYGKIWSEVKTHFLMNLGAECNLMKERVCNLH